MKLVEIPIERFESEKELTRDTFVLLPLNRKSVRLALAGGTISAATLQRIREKGHGFLQIAEESAIDPLTFAVHPAPPAVTVAPATAAEPAATADSPARSFQAEAETAEPEQRFDAEEAATEPEQRFGADGTAAEPERNFSPDEAPAEPEQRFGQGREAEETKRIGDKIQAEKDDSATRVDGREEKDGSSRKFGADQEEKDRTLTRFGRDQEKPTALMRLRQQMEEQGEDGVAASAMSEAKQKAIAEARTVILSSKVSEKIVELSERAQNAEPAERASLRDQMRSLRAGLERIEAGGDAPADLDAEEELQSVSESVLAAERPEQIQEVSDRLSAHELTRRLAAAALEDEDKDIELSRSTSSRDLPATVSRLAAYLGYSLGYTDVNFLADLACGAIVHFARKEGAQMNDEQLPAFTQKIFQESSGSLVDDSKDILLFLDAYLSDKECDRSQKDFLKKIFDRAVMQFDSQENAPSGLSIRKWASFVERGPTMDSHSVCTRAAARAMKCARAATL